MNMRHAGIAGTVTVLLAFYVSPVFPVSIKIEAPDSITRFDPVEFVMRVEEPPFENAFTEAELTGEFVSPQGDAIRVDGFADAQDGSLFRLRFCPENAGATYAYTLRLQGCGIDQRFTGQFEVKSSERPGAVIVNPDHPKHFVFSGSRKPFYHLGYTAYHLFDPSNDDAQVDATIDYCAREGFNKIRFLLTGYPRDFDRRTSRDVEYGVGDPWRAPNYGSKGGQVNPLPAWLGEPHRYDFSRFNVAYWQRIDRAVMRMRERGIVATCIVTIEKQDLPKEYGKLTPAEYRLYRYAIARLAAFDNIWWDLGNEHNEYRNQQWGKVMGGFVKKHDPYDRLCSAHGYKEFLYPKADWADFIITQQYGDEKTVHDWVLKYGDDPKPYVNEEYGYEGDKDQPEHGLNADWVRRCHWSIAMAGGYATYGDWSGGVSYFYMGEPGPGQAARQLKYLRAFFEAIPFSLLVPHDELTSNGFCLAARPKHYIFYFPHGGEAQIDLSGDGHRPLVARWFDPRTGHGQAGPAVQVGKCRVVSPSSGDWVLHVQEDRGREPEQ